MTKIGKLGRHKATGLFFVRINGKQKYLGHKTTTEAEAIEMRQRIIIELGAQTPNMPASNDDQKLNILFKMFLDHKKNDGVEKHRKTRNDFCNLFLERFGDQTPREVKPFHVEAWLEEQETWGSTYRGNCLKILSSAFNWCHDNLDTTKNPTKGFKRPQALTSGEEVVLTSDEFSALYSKANEIYKPIMMVLWESGARPNEILGASGDEYDEKQHAIVKMKHKTRYIGKKRIILLTPTAEAIIVEKIKEMGTGQLFWSEEKNKIQPDVFNQAVKRLKKIVGIKHKVIGYSFRHSFAVKHIERLIPLNIVASWLGNTVAICEKHYGHTIERVSNTRALLTELPK